MGGVDIVLVLQWLQYLGMINFNFKKLFLIFFLEGNEIELRVIVGKPGAIHFMNYWMNYMEKFTS